MPVAGWIIIGIFAFGVVAGLVVHFGWSISTQHRDHGVAASSGPVTRRRIWAKRTPSAHAGPVNAEAIPGATDDTTAATRTGTPPQSV